MVQLLETSPYPCGWGIQVGNTLCQRAQDAKLHPLRLQGSEELQIATISMCRVVLMCVPWLNLSCRADGLHGVLQVAGPPITQVRRPTGEHHSSLPAHMHRFPSEDALEDANVYPGPCLTCDSDSQPQVS